MNIPNNVVTWMIAVAVPVVAALTILHSQVVTMQETKAEKVEVVELKGRLTEAITKNTTVLGYVNTTLIELGRRLDEQQKFGNRRGDWDTPQADNKVPYNKSKKAD